ncbi:hypothetical protein CFK37_14135 [Virgibacillus phasianinus]|uniref:Competence protein ComG n=1 Tax=Virgibacillus phasianinus TaxID=2017483 RepID=A0A220U580_9BACI|nr:competence type IV pilus minor pilin ComGD [Virgibacillus phasianinus]ASK63205.1 hypothetical protein CFK37_14135 [Virgibacillus phasianinus]
MDNKNGFTLIEVIFVLGALAILLVLSAPIKFAVLDTQKEQQFLTAFENDLLYMQSISYLSKDKVGLEIHADYYKIVVTKNYKVKDIFQRSIPNDWKFDLLTIQDNFISFNSSGTIRQPGTIRLRTNKSMYKIVFPLGKGRCYIEKL